MTPLGFDSGEFLMGLSLEKQMVAMVDGRGGSSSTGWHAPYFSTSWNLTILRPREVASSTILGFTSLMVTITLRHGGAEVRMLVTFSSSNAMINLNSSTVASLHTESLIMLSKEYFKLDTTSLERFSLNVLSSFCKKIVLILLPPLTSFHTETTHMILHLDPENHREEPGPWSRSRHLALPLSTPDSCESRSPPCCALLHSDPCWSSLNQSSWLSRSPLHMSPIDKEVTESCANQDIFLR